MLLALRPGIGGGENPIPKDRPEVFVIRVPPTNRPFSWEIHRYGSLVLQRGIEEFATTGEARMAGETNLAELIRQGG